ncbi:MAG: hypothetical protein PT956_04925 [Firmicutes bacterium]|nr:hypothetical protein [Ezakiella sp.]MDD7761991.1 hypothetical protein [Bacillota bacterium]
MALLVELAPKLFLKFKGNQLQKSVNFNSGSLIKIAKNYNEEIKLLIAAGGPIGMEIEKLVCDMKVDYRRIDIKDDASIDVLIEDKYNRSSASGAIHRLTFDDIQKIKSAYISGIYQEKSIVLPINEIEDELANEFLKKASDYYKSTIIFGDKAIYHLNKNPNIAFIKENSVIEEAPFKIVSEYELIKYSFSLVEDRKTYMIIPKENGILFFRDNICESVEVNSVNSDMLLFGALFVIENNISMDNWARLLASFAEASIKERIGEISERSKKYRIGVSHR